MMARADVFALPSAPEGFGLVHLEAMTQGTPVIGCLDQGPADFIEDGVSGHLVPYGDVEALTRALRGHPRRPRAGARRRRGRAHGRRDVHLGAERAPHARPLRAVRVRARPASAA